MKLIAAVKKLFFINLLCLLWHPYFCDKELKNEDLQGIQNPETLPGDSNRVENVPSEQKETLQPIKIGVENYQKKDEIKPSVEYVNTKIKQEESIQEVGDKISQSSVIQEQIKKSSISNLESSMPIQPSRLDSTVKRDNKKNEESLETPVKYPEVTEPLLFSGKSELVDELPAHETSDLSSKLVASKVPKIIETTESSQQQYEGMPSFDEWKKMMLAEQEKGGQKMPSPSPPGKKISSQKRRRNYSSYECGAKIVASNTEAEGKSRILNELVDDYMLNPCKAKIWFVIELCETVQANQIELANFELFSSCPKDFAVYSSDHFPSRDWVLLGTFTAAEQRVLQSFELKQEGFGKFIKIELLSHYGKEHYCPLSIVRIFGTSMVDEYEEMETQDRHRDVPDDDLDRLDIPVEDPGTTNIFGSATDAVFSIVKKAAQALGQQSLEERQINETATEQQNETKICKMVSDSKCSIDTSLFRFLRQCEQCISHPIGYYSLAQPHCRFFQAALGPDRFQAVCDDFKEHFLDTPLPLAKETSRSPPPQILRLPLDSDNLFTVVTLHNSSALSPVDKTVVVNVTRANRTQLEPSVQATPIAETNVNASVTEAPTLEIPSSVLEEELSDGGGFEELEEEGLKPAGQKESVFMRMNNRIKSLELNMSLSSQYLQELSQRYRRQMEEMQRAFNRTIQTLNDTARKAADKDSKQQEVINSLQWQVSNLTRAVELLLDERSSVLKEMMETHVCLMMVEAIVMVTVMSLCVRRLSGRAAERSIPRYVSKRRNSADSSTPPISRKVKRRSASEEAIREGEDLLIIEPLQVLTGLPAKVKKKNRKRNRGLQRSASQPIVQLLPSSASQYKSCASHSDGCINGRHSTCENCNGNIFAPDKEKRSNAQPLQNLTNGRLNVYNKPDQKKTKFSFKRILKFSKRDSI